MIDITYPNVESAPLGILRDQEGDLLVKRESEQIAWLRTSGNWRALPRSWYPTLVGIRLPLRLVAPLPAELTDEALRAAAEGRTAERVEPYPEVGDRVRPEDLARLPVGAVVDTRDGTGAPLIVRGPAGWGWGNACKGERLPDSPRWGDSISSGAMSRQVGDKAVLVGLGLEDARGRAFDEGLAAQGYQPAIDAVARLASAGLPRVGDRLRPEDWERLPTGAVVDARDGGLVTGELANLLVRGPRGWGYASITGGGRPIWEGAIPSEDVARCAGAVLIGLGLDPKRHATEEALREALAAQGYQPAKREAAPAISYERRVGEKVGPDDWSRLPVGAVVDSGDRSRSPFLVRGPRGWGWASARANGLGATLDGNVPSAACATGGFRSARLVALGFEGGGPERLRALLERNGTQVDADGRVAAPTPAPAPAAAPTPTALRPGDPLSKWEDLPDGGVAVDKAGDVAVRIGDRRGWAKIGLRLPLSSPWRQMLDTPFPLSRDNARDSRFVGVVPAPVTIERVRALVEGTPLPSPGQPAKREPSAAELCRRARDRRVAAQRRALAAAEERLAEVAEVWTVTASGGITRRTAGRRSRPAGVVCSMADMPGGDKAAKRAEARRRVAERDERRAAAEAEVARLRAALYPGPTSGRTFLDVGGARVEVSPTTTAAEVAIALGLAGVSARASGNVLTVDLEGSLAAGQVSIQTFEA